MRLSWKREAILIQPRPVRTKQLELEAAKQILSEFSISFQGGNDRIMKRLYV